jgi:UPF0716 protein FxsA
MRPAQNKSLFGRLLVLFTVVPIVELALLVWLGGEIGFWPTVGLIAGTALLGSYLAHREGLSAYARFRARLAEGGLPGNELTDGIIILIAGALLLTPGVLTDVVGFLGLLPPTRAVIKRAVLSRVRRGMQGGSIRVATWGSAPSFTPPGAPPPSSSTPGNPPPDDEVIDVEYEDVRRNA